MITSSSPWGKNVGFYREHCATITTSTIALSWLSPQAPAIKLALHVLLHCGNFMTGIYYMQDVGLSGTLMPVVTLFSIFPRDFGSPPGLSSNYKCMSSCRSLMFNFIFKRIIQPKMKVLSLFSHPHFVPNLKGKVTLHFSFYFQHFSFTCMQILSKVEVW